MEPAVMKRHIELYVNDFTVDVGPEGIRAIQRLFDEAERKNIFPSALKPLFAGDDR